MGRNWKHLVCLALLAAFPAHGVTVYVDQRAPGPTHDGKSWQTAFSTVQAAIAVSKGGVDIWVARGVYPANVTIPPGVGLYGGFEGGETTPDERPARPGLTVLESGGSTAPVVKFASGASRTTVLDGFTVRGLDVAAGVGVIDCRYASPIISHNIVSASRPGGRPTFTPLIYALQGSPAIRNNILTSSAGDGIEVVDGGATIVNNTIAGNGSAGILVSRPTTLVVTNNILAFNLWGVRLDAPGEMVFTNNCLYRNPGGDFEGTESRIGQDGNLAADPRFSSYAYGELHLAPGSPCIDAGATTDLAGSLDVDLGPRVEGARVDIGADEWNDIPWNPEPRIVRVSPEGDDAHDGSSWAEAMRTLPAGIRAAAETGGEVWVAEGTYTPDADAPLGTGIALPARVYVYGGFAGSETERDQRDVGRHPTLLTNREGSGAVVTAIGGHGQSALDGFTVKVTAQDSRAVFADIICAGASPILRHNIFGGGIRPPGQLSIVTDGGFPTVEDCVFTNAIVRCPAVITFGRCVPTVRRNVFRNNTDGIAVVKCIVCPTSEFTGNLFDGNTASQGIITPEYSARVVNNTFVNNTAQTSAYGLTLRGNVFANNIVAFNTFQMAVGYRGAPPPWLHNNLFWQSGPTYGLEGANGNITADPLFVDAGNGDDHLSDASPAVDAGDDSLVPAGATDLDGAPRRQGRHVDLGAYESAFTSPTVHWEDIRAALKIAGGLQPATPEDMHWLHPDTSSPAITLPDALTLLKELQP